MISAFQWLALLVFESLAYAAVFIGASAQRRTKHSTWLSDELVYAPRFLRIPWILSLTWIVFYGLSGTAVFLLWQVDNGGSTKWQAAMALWLAQHILMLTWPWSWRELALSLLLVALALAISIAALVFFYVERVAAGAVLTPYVAYLCVAFVVQLSLVMHNQGVAKKSNIMRGVHHGLNILTSPAESGGGKRFTTNNS
jgi:tryptophan-rich sensory protein